MKFPCSSAETDGGHWWFLFYNPTSGFLLDTERPRKKDLDALRRACLAEFEGRAMAPQAACFVHREFLGFLSRKDEQIPVFEMHEQEDLVELWTRRCTSRSLLVIVFDYYDDETAENGPFKGAPLRRPSWTRAPCCSARTDRTAT